MLFLGYLAKRRLFGRDVKLPPVEEVCSVSDCISAKAPDPAWTFNRAGCYATAEEARGKIPAGEEAEFRLFAWWLISGSADTFDGSLPPLPDAPAEQQLALLGFDVVSRSQDFDHSPLSCNGLAAEWPVNRWCLFDTEAQALRAAARFNEQPAGCEPGAYFVVRVDRVVDALPAAR